MEHAGNKLLFKKKKALNILILVSFHNDLLNYLIT